MRKRIFIVLVLIYVCFCSNGQAIIVDSVPSEPNLLKGLLFYENQSGENNFEKAKSLNLAGKFRKQSTHFLKFDYSKSTFWLTFKVKNQLSKDVTLYLQFENPYIDTIEVYQNNKLIAQSGDMFVFNRRPIPTKYFSFKLEIDSAKTSDFYVYLSKRHEVSEIPVLLLGEKQFFQKEKYDHLFWGTFWGSVITFLFFSLFLYFTTRYAIYLVYAIYLLSAFLFSSTIFGAEFIWPNAPIFNAYDISAFYPLLLGSHLLLMLKFVDFKKVNNKYLYYANYAMIVFLYTGAFYQLFLSLLDIPPSSELSYFFMEVAQLLFYFYIFLLFSSIIIRITQKSKEAIVFLFSMTPITFGLFISIYARLDIFYLPFSSIYIQPVCILIEVVFLSISLSIKYKRVILEKNNLELSLVEKERTMLKRILESQDEERKNIAIDLHDDMGGILTILHRKIDDSLPESALKIDLIKISSLATATLRKVSKKIMPNEIIHGSLVGAMNALIKQFENKQVKIHFIKFGKEKKLSDDTKLNLYRIAAELINNAMKHAKAQDIYLQLNFFDDYLYLSVEDNGKTYRIINMEQDSGGIGLKNISLRVEYLRGVFLKSQTANGSVFAIELPYKDDED